MDWPMPEHEPLPVLKFLRRFLAVYVEVSIYHAVQKNTF
jgi:hypothetical protein